MENHYLNDLRVQRLEKLKSLRDSGENPYKSKFTRSNLIKEIIDSKSNIKNGEKTSQIVALAGRIMALRQHGKASFAEIMDASGRIQLYLSSNILDEEEYAKFLEFDIGDFVGIKGEVFKTRRGELSIQVEKFEILSKSLRPLPEKWHGLRDIETRFRQRYVDLIMNPEIKEIFLVRTYLIQEIRNFMENEDFIEVETPMLQQIPGGATAKPFVTHHKALGIDLYLRIAPELYLKRLVVGGLEKVYELNRNFRNEGMSVKHNPEFTMLEVYQAYADYLTMMDLTERLIKSVIKKLIKKTKINYQGEEIEFKNKWKKLTMIDSIKEYAGKSVSFDMEKKDLVKMANDIGVEIETHWGKGKIINEIFEKKVEDNLIQPTFIIDYPTETTPLARQKEDNPELTERFELIIAGREIANAFSELIDPLEQRKRFEKQMELREKGDEEAQSLDEDYLRALEYGLPPTGGLGIGIDRLVMLLTDSYSIREVLFFPHMRPEQ